MTPDLVKSLADELDQRLDHIRSIIASARESDLSDRHDQCEAFISSSLHSIRRISGTHSTFSERAGVILQTNYYGGLGDQAKHLAGVLDALKGDLVAGRLASFEQLAHGALFADYTDMASHLLDSGYKDAATVIVGSTLEVHLRQLCAQNAIEIDVLLANGSRPKMADQLNSDLARCQVYGKLEQKQVTAWLDLRNKAAHGNYNEYDVTQVRLLIDGVCSFMIRHPA